MVKEQERKDQADPAKMREVKTLILSCVLEYLLDYDNIYVYVHAFTCRLHPHKKRKKMRNIGLKNEK